MKKMVLAAALAVLVAAGSAFADHPGHLAIGFGWQGGSAFDAFNLNNGVSLFLKLPVIPIYWGGSFGIGSDDFRISVTGDKYLFDATIIPGVNFGWFLGVGGYFSFASNDAWTGLGVGGRVPIGVYIIPVSFLEVFLDIAPRAGLDLGFPKAGDSSFDFGLGWAGDLGFRFWL